MKSSLLVLGLMAAFPFAAAAADNISYNFAEVDYVGTNSAAKGWGAKGSYAVAPNFHVFGGYSQQKFDDLGAGLDKLRIDQWNVGLGYNQEINKNVDLLARVAYQNLDPKQSGKDFNGWAVESGINASFGPRVSTYVLAGYEKYSKRDNIDPSGEFYGRLGGQYNFSKNWALAGDMKMYSRGGDLQWSVGPRFSW